MLFKPVEGVKTRIDYDGLVIRCATAGEAEAILTETGNLGRNYRVLMLQTADGDDYVVAGAVGWREDEEADDRDPSGLA